MGHQVLVTIDLPGATREQRDSFYEVLRKEEWQKIETLTTSWKISFNDRSTRSEVIAILHGHLRRAKERSTVPQIEYAMQLDLNPVKIDSL